MKRALLITMLFSFFCTVYGQDSQKNSSNSQDSSSVIFEEDGDLLITDESEELLIEDKSAPHVKDSTKSENKSKPKQVKRENPTKGVENPDRPVQERVKVTNPVFQVQKKKNSVKAESSIDFSKQVTHYRSPKKAFLFSLLAPGAGQFYVKEKIRGAIYGVVEVGLITGVITQAVKRKEYKDDALKIAEEHYSIDRFKTHFNSLKGAVVDTTATENLATLFSIFGSVKTPDEILNIIDTNFSDNPTDYYESSEYNKYVGGWDDAVLATPDNIVNSHLYDPNMTPISFGTSAYQNQYLDKLDQSSSAQTRARTFGFLLIANHLVSAIDAFIAAKAYNGRLLNKKTAWERIHLDQEIGFTRGDLCSSFAVRVKF